MSFTQLDLWNDHIDDVWLSFKDARALVHTWNLEYREDWNALVADSNGIDHPGIPANPEIIYRHTGWKDWEDWLVHPDRRMVYASFFEAREFARSLRLREVDDWYQYFRVEPPIHKTYGLEIPSRPFFEYEGKGWVDWSDWFGLHIAFTNYNETKKFIHTLHLRSPEEWDVWCQGNLFGRPKKPKVIYRYPELAYRGRGWTNWKDWLG